MRPHAPIPCRRPRPDGFTLIELLVVITVIAILAGMLLPAIKGAVETSRRKTTTQLIAQVGMAIAQYEDSYGEAPPERAPSPTLYSSECLAVFLGRGLLGSEAGYSADQKTVLRAKRDFLVVRKTFVVDTDRNNYPEVVDSWGQPILYNRGQFPTANYATWSYADTQTSAGRPLHNPKGYDLFSGNTYGSRILGDPGKTGLAAYETKALQRRSSFSTEHHFRYPYEYEHRKYGRKLNTYIGNW